MHPPGSGFAAVPAFFSREFQVTPGSGGRLRSGPGNEGMSLALFASAVFLNPQRQQATSSACLQGLVLHHGKLWSDRFGRGWWPRPLQWWKRAAAFNGVTRAGHSPLDDHLSRACARPRTREGCVTSCSGRGSHTVEPSQSVQHSQRRGTATTLKMRTHGTEVWFQFEYIHLSPP